MRRALLLAGLTACGFQHGALQGSPTGDAGGDDGSMSMDGPPQSPAVHFTSVQATLGSVRAGAYGWQVTAVLRNDLSNDITAIGATLTFSAAGADRASSFRWRDIDAREGVSALPPTTIAANSEATFTFVVDALPWLLGPGPIAINGAATFTSGGTVLSATPATTSESLPFSAMNAPIVVNTLSDEATSNTTTSLREALTQAKAVSGLDHIMFDPTVFTSGSTSTLSFALGPLPTLDGSNGDIVIDGHGANVTLAVDNAWTGSTKWPFKVTSGNVAIANLTFKDFGYSYPVENLTSNDCGNNDQAEGGAIRVEGGTLILEGNTFDDADVSERNCYAALVRYEGGSNHRIIANHWTNPSQDAMNVNANVHEISDNVIDAGNNIGKTDDGILISTQASQDTWVTGNLVVQMEFSGLYAGGADIAGHLYVINNTFAHNGQVASSAVFRNLDRQITFKNNFYIGNNPAAIAVNNTGSGFDFDHEALMSNALCDSACGLASESSTITVSSSAVANSTGTTFADFTPQAGSTVLDSGVTYIDRNGSQPGHFNGAGTERGAVEAP